MNSVHRVVIFLLIAVMLTLGRGEIMIYKSNVSTENWVCEETIRDTLFTVGYTEAEWHDALEGAAPSVINSLPTIEFEDELPILVSLGKRPTGGYAVEIDSVIQKGTTLIVTVSCRSPQPDEFVAMAFTYPYSLVVLNRAEIGTVDRILFVDRERTPLE